MDGATDGAKLQIYRISCFKQPKQVGDEAEVLSSGTDKRFNKENSRNSRNSITDETAKSSKTLH